MTNSDRRKKRFLSQAIPLTALWTILSMHHLLSWWVSAFLITAYLSLTAVTLVKSYRRDIRELKQVKPKPALLPVTGSAVCLECGRSTWSVNQVYCPDCAAGLNGLISKDEYRARIDALSFGTSVPLATGPSVSGAADPYYAPGWHRCDGNAYASVRFCPVHGNSPAEPMHQYLADRYHLPLPVVTEPQKEELPYLGPVDETAGLTDAQVNAIQYRFRESLKSGPVVLPSNSFASVAANVQKFSDSQLLAAALADVLTYRPEGQAELSADLLEYLAFEVAGVHSNRGMHWEVSPEWRDELRLLKGDDGKWLIGDDELLFGCPVTVGAFGIPKLVHDAPYSYFAEKRMHKP